MKSALFPVFAYSLCAHAAFYIPGVALPLMVCAHVALILLRRVSRARFAFYAGTAAGALFLVPHLYFLYGIFGFFALPLWFLVAMWHGWFVLLVRGCSGMRRGLAAAPALWMGLEYFRSEVWPLKFAYLTPGSLLPVDSTAAVSWHGLMSWAGVYGCGAVITGMAAWAVAHRPFFRTGLMAAAGLALAWVPSRPPGEEGREIRLAGAQLELPSDGEFKRALNALKQAEPQADAYVFSEFTFAGDFPAWLHEWCREHAKHVILGGPRYLEAGKSTDFENTAWVMGPDGEIQHRQVKSVPVQFFADGTPAKSRVPWNSPFGRLGLCICYDLNYRFVTDDLAAAGMQALIVPTMDLQKWGLHQHELGARMTALRAVENGVPIFRLTSSGISVAALADGREVATLGFGERGAQMAAVLPLVSAGRIPLDRWLVWPAFGFACFAPLFLVFRWLSNRKTKVSAGGRGLA